MSWLVLSTSLLNFGKRREFLTGSLARDIVFGRQGRFYDRGYEAQLNRASALSVVINAIAVWNTRYFEKAQAALASKGILVPETIWQHLSTLQWAHIHLNGSYHFTDILLKDDFRPLREYRGSYIPRTTQSPPPGNADEEEMLALEAEEERELFQLSLFQEEER